MEKKDNGCKKCERRKTKEETDQKFDMHPVLRNGAAAGINGI